MVIAYDLGTGGIKASAVTADGEILCSAFVPYDTFYGPDDIQEQSPDDWWNSLVTATRNLLEKNPGLAATVKAVAISGHSLGVVPIGCDGKLLRQRTPIWSDKRAEKEAEDFFRTIDCKKWYEQTGNGFPAACYSIFKIVWYRNNEPEMFSKIWKIIGTKDYCNFCLTGKVYTDFSYASGTGAFSLDSWKYIAEYIEAAGLSPDIFPEIVPSDAVIGEITDSASKATGLPVGVKVISGGVDNSCMALGAKGIKDGRIYMSLGTSAWIALVSKNPVLDYKYRPYVFAHVIKGLYASATSIFSAGRSLQWVHDTFCPGLSYGEIDEYAAKAAPGVGGLIFNPSLAGGSMLEPTPNMTGAFFGMKLSHNLEDILRATMEGIAMNLRIALDVLGKAEQKILVVGGGAKSSVWMQIFADIYRLSIEKTSVDQQAASLGAAALALKGTGLWKGYDAIDSIHRTERIYTPDSETYGIYEPLQARFNRIVEFIGEMYE